MANTFQIKRGTDLSNAGTPAAGEPVWNSSTSKLYIGDGSTAASSLSQVGSEFLPLAGGTLTGGLTGTTGTFSGDVALTNSHFRAEAGSGSAYSTELHTELGVSSTVISYLDSIGGASWTGQIRFRTSTGGGSLGDRLILKNDNSATFSGSIASGSITATGFITCSSSLFINSGERFYLDGGSNTYITESSADHMKFYTNNALAITINDGQDVTMASKLSCSADGNNNGFQVNCAGGTAIAKIWQEVTDAGTLGLFNGATQNVYLDGNTGNATFAGTVTAPYLDIGRDGSNQSANFNGVVKIDVNTAGKNTFQFDTSGVDEGWFAIKNVDTVAIRLDADGNSYLNGGNVGIGTANAGAKLHIEAGNGEHLRFSYGSDIYLNKIENQFNAGTASGNIMRFHVCDGTTGGTVMPLELYGSLTAIFAGDIRPDGDNDADLGSSTKRWANLYVGDMHLKNDRGDWTVIEEEDYLSLKNNKTGKTYKLVMEEV